MIYSAINHKIHERDDMTKSSNQVSYFVLDVAIFNVISDQAIGFCSLEYNLNYSSYSFFTNVIRIK